MMNAKEIANTWRDIVQIYNQTKELSPVATICKIVCKFGIDQTKEVFATIAAIKKNDRRIYGANRDYMNSIPIDTEIAEWKSGNPIIYAGLDDIHTTDINYLISELRKLDK